MLYSLHMATKCGRGRFFPALAETCNKYTLQHPTMGYDMCVANPQ